MSDKSLIYPLFIPHEACPGSCVYCDQHKISGAPSFDMDKAVAAVKAFIRRNPGRPKEVAFYGGSFTALPLSRQQELLDGISRLLDPESSIRISTHPAYIDDAALDLCLKHNVRTIELGIQDFCDRPLKESGRNYTGAMGFAAAQKVRQYGFILGVQLIPGLPGADAETLKENKAYLQKLKPDLLRLYPLVVIKDTQLHEMYQMGSYLPLSVTEAVQICADYAEFCDLHGIRIIKYGLPSNLDRTEVAAGAYHPAFGELVKQELLIRQIKAAPETAAQLSDKQRHLLRAHKCRYLQQLEATNSFRKRDPSRIRGAKECL